MTTKREIVGSAFAELGIGNWEFDLQPDEIQDAVNRLDAMMARWSSEGVRIGYNGTSNDPDTDSGVPDVALEAIRCNLALRLSPSFGRQVNPMTSMLAAEGYSYLVAYFMTVPQRPYPSTLPLGSGNRLATIGGRITFFPQQPQQVAVGPDSLLDLGP